MRFSLRSRWTYCSAIAVAAIGLTVVGTAHADVVVYDNLTNFTLKGDENQGATSGDHTTNLLADDITPIAGAAGEEVTNVEFDVTNFSDSEVFANANVRFYDTTGAGGGPGNLIQGYDLTSLSYSPESDQKFFFAPTPGTFFLPSTDGGKFWAAIFFTSVDDTAAQLNSLGQEIYTPPTVGSSTDLFFRSSGSPGTFTSNDPTGNLGSSGGSPNPSVSFGWSFSTAAISAGTVAPESNTAILLGLGLAAAGGLLIARRRATA